MTQGKRSSSTQMLGLCYPGGNLQGAGHARVRFCTGGGQGWNSKLNVWLSCGSSQKHGPFPGNVDTESTQGGTFQKMWPSNSSALLIAFGNVRFH